MADQEPVIRAEDVEQVVALVFSTTMGLEAAPQIPPAPNSHETNLITAAVSLAGEWQGAVLMQCGPEQACALAGRFLGDSAPDRVDDDVRDVLGELTNMIAGNLKCTLRPGIRLSVPLVFEGAGEEVRLCGGTPVYRSTFGAEDGPFRVTVLDANEAIRASSFRATR